MSFWKKIFAKDGSSADENTAAAAEQEREEKAKLRNADALKFDGLRLLQAGYAEPALNYLARSIELHPEFESRYYYAEALTRLGRNAEAIELYQSLAEEAPEHISLNLALLALLVAEERYEEAEQRLGIAAALSLEEAEEASLRLYEAMLAAGTAQYERAIVAADRALELRKDMPRAALYKAKSLLQLGRADEAEAWVEAMRTQFPEEERFPLYAAEAALCQKEPEKAERALRDAIEIDPFNEEAHLRLATLLSGQNRTEEAVSLLKPFVDEERATVCIKQQLAALYRVQGNESAAEALEATISEDDLAETDGRADFNNLYTGGLY